MPNQSGLEISVNKADEEEGETEVGDEEEPCYIATVCREEVEAAAQDMALEQNMTSTADRERGGRGWMLFLFCACIECCIAQRNYIIKEFVRRAARKTEGVCLHKCIFFLSFPNH